MYEVKKGPVPVSVRGAYNFGDLTEVGDWFFAPGKKSSTVRSAVTGYKKRTGQDIAFSVVSGTYEGEKGVFVSRTK